MVKRRIAKLSGDLVFTLENGLAHGFVCIKHTCLHICFTYKTYMFYVCFVFWIIKHIW